MKVYRLSRSKYAKDLSGKGAEQHGGRWNSTGTALLYTAQSRALCVLELAVHIPLGNLPIGYRLIEIEFPQSSVKILLPNELPANWSRLPHSAATQKIGDAFANQGTHLALKVPSAVVKGDFNYLIKPKHPLAHSISILSIETFEFDTRLGKSK
jgi:RES domain-containing protein